MPINHINVDYELNYWKTVWEDKQIVTPYHRMVKTLRLKTYRHMHRVVDLGCGPLNGIFSVMDFPVMLGIDPLWKEYQASFGIRNKKVIKIIGDSEKFNWVGEADLIVSVNALDHSGDLVKSAREIRSHLRKDGIFILHMHMRTDEQLNEGHKLIFTEDTIDNAFKGIKRKWKVLYDTCPIHGGHYKTYTACWENRKS